MIKNRIAHALLRQRDVRGRRILLIKYAVLLALTFLAHTYFVNLATPLRLIPQTMSAIAMGYLLTALAAVRNFRIVAEFIDWEKVTAMEEPQRLK